MTWDHASKLFFLSSDNYVLRCFFVSFGSIAFPLFAYLFSDSLLKSRHREKLLLNLLVFALISELPFQALKALSDGLAPTFSLGFSNMLFSFLYAALAWWGFERYKNLFPLLLAALISIITASDYNIYAVLMVFFCCYFKEGDRIKAMSGILFLCYFFPLALDLFNFGFVPEVFFPDFFRLAISQLSVLIIHFYNGERGKGLKYLFYMYYPLHMSVLALLFRR